jgi:hypothetical protein
MFSKVYFLRLWVPYAVFTLFTTLLTVYGIGNGRLWLSIVLHCL